MGTRVGRVCGRAQLVNVVRFSVWVLTANLPGSVVLPSSWVGSLHDDRCGWGSGPLPEFDQLAVVVAKPVVVRRSPQVRDSYAMVLAMDRNPCRAPEGLGTSCDDEWTGGDLEVHFDDVRRVSVKARCDSSAVRIGSPSISVRSHVRVVVLEMSNEAMQSRCRPSASPSFSSDITPRMVLVNCATTILSIRSATGSRGENQHGSVTASASRGEPDLPASHDANTLAQSVPGSSSIQCSFDHPMVSSGVSGSRA